MSLGVRSVGKEVGTAFAVLAMYFLLLLAPWHQAASLQRDLADLGYASSVTVDICGPAAMAGEQEQHSDSLKCAVAGIGKFDFVLVEPGSIALRQPDDVLIVSYSIDATRAHAAVAPHVGQARAPPAAA